jgi:hypothetical protein
VDFRCFCVGKLLVSAIVVSENWYIEKLRKYCVIAWSLVTESKDVVQGDFGSCTPNSIRSNSGIPRPSLAV